MRETLDVKMKFGDILRELREEKGLTQKELGTIINISDRVIGYWESNKYSNEEVKLINCYRLSSNDDKNVIRAVLNKYKKSEDRKKEAT